MDKQIQLKFNDNILKEAMSKFGIEDSQIKKLDSFMNFIYEFSKDGKDYILRISHSFRRNESLIQAEVDWINYLSNNGANVHRAINSENNNLVEHIDDNEGGFFLAVAFTKANGALPRKHLYTCTDEELFYLHGKTIGKIHSLSKKYIPMHKNCKRYGFNEPSALADIEKNFIKTEPLVKEKYYSEKKYLSKLPKDKDSYGLVHSDPHFGNFFIDSNNKITMFDFDECEYNWYIQDIAIPLFCEFYPDNDNQDYVNEYTYKYLNNFMKGYYQENYIDPMWLNEIPHFFKFREFIMYGLVLGTDNPNFQNGFMNGRKKRLENDIPYVNFDFKLLVENINKKYRKL
jgi:amicoumacin kinase